MNFFAESRFFYAVSHACTLECWCDKKYINPTSPGFQRNVVTLFNRSESRRVIPPSIPPSLSSSLPDTVIFQFIVIYNEVPQTSLNPTQFCWSGDGSSSIQASKHRWELTYNQFKTTNLCQPIVTSKNVNNVHQKIAFLLKFMQFKRNDLTQGFSTFLCWWPMELGNILEVTHYN